jgi:hypothetical protein
MIFIQYSLRIVLDSRGDRRPIFLSHSHHNFHRIGKPWAQPCDDVKAANQSEVSKIGNTGWEKKFADFQHRQLSTLHRNFDRHSGGCTCTSERADSLLDVHCVNYVWFLMTRDYGM